MEALHENERTRYTITPQARKTLLTRLLKLNHQRAAEEQNALPAKGIKAKKHHRIKQANEML